MGPGRLCLPLGLVTLLIAPATAQTTDAERLATLTATPPARVEAVETGQTLRLDDGREVRLDGILAPDTEREAAAARAALAALAEGRMVSLHGPDPTPDRYGRSIGEVTRDDGLWLEAALLDAGLVRVATRPGHAGLADALLAHEAGARSARLGLWARPAFRVHAPETVSTRSGVFEIVEGRIASVETHGNATWLEFSRDHRLPAVRIERRAFALFRGAGIDPHGFVGANLRLRGWTFWQGRPIIAVDHPEAIERLQPGQD
jgi:endonuclease YncB( thermonuclease family)